MTTTRKTTVKRATATRRVAVRTSSVGGKKMTQPQNDISKPKRPTLIKWDGAYTNIRVDNIQSIDLAGANKGSLTPGITFGSELTEGISSNRTGKRNPFGMDFYTDDEARLSIDKKGRVGIGTDTPNAALDIFHKPGANSPSAGLHIYQQKGVTGQALLLSSYRSGPGSGIKFHTSGKEYEIFCGGGVLHIMDHNAGVDRLVIDRNGNLGIGMPPDGYKFEVGGDARVTGDLNVTGDIILPNADVAEEFNIAEAESIEDGSVMVLQDAGILGQSQKAYDKRVVGIISGAGNYQPGIILDKQASQPNRRPIALIGKVYCKVDAEYAPIEVGDLLTTSPTTGHAMKASDPLQAFGAVIGKALLPLPKGRGMIPVLIALQ